MKPFKLFFVKKNSRISKSSKVYPLSLIRNSVIKDYTYVSYNCTINNSYIGKFCSIANGVKIGLGMHPIDFISTSPFFYSEKNPLEKFIVRGKTFEDSKEVIIGNDVWIGADVVVLDGVKIGNGAIIGANSVVTRDVEPYSIVGGVPAKFIKYRFDESIIKNLVKIGWWEMPLDFFEQESVRRIFSQKLEVNELKKLEILINEFMNTSNK